MNGWGDQQETLVAGDRKRSGDTTQLSDYVDVRSATNGEARFYCRFLPDTTVLETSAELAFAVGMTVDQYVGTRWIDGLPPDDKQYVRQQLDGVSPDNPSYFAESRLQSIDGRTIWVRFQNQAFFDDDGKVVFLIGWGEQVGAPIVSESCECPLDGTCAPYSDGCPMKRRPGPSEAAS